MQVPSPFGRHTFLLIISFAVQEGFYFDVVLFVYFCFGVPCLRRHIQKHIAKTGVKEHTDCFLLEVLWFWVLHLSLYPIFCSLLYVVWENSLILCISHTDFPTPFIEKTVFSPLYILASIHFWALYSVPLIYVSVFVPVSYCFDDCSFLIKFEIRRHDAPRFILFSSRLFWIFRVFCVSIQIVYLFQWCGNVTYILIGIELNL